MVEHSPQILASKEKATKNQAQKVINEGLIYMEYKLNGFRKQVALKPVSYTHLTLPTNAEV